MAVLNNQISHRLSRIRSRLKKNCLLLIAFFSAWLCMAYFGGKPTQAEVDIADAPMFTRIQPPPANIMILLDDSSSMNFSVLIRGFYDGRYPNPNQEKPGEDGYGYVFDNLGDSVYTGEAFYFGQEGRKYWKSQWHEINIIYYNPNLTYEPWPNYGKLTFENADIEHARAHPVIDTGNTFDLDGKSFSASGIDVKHAHYFVKYGDGVYMVVIDGDDKGIKYYTVGVTGTGLAEKVDTLSLIDPPPDGIVTGRTYAEERQNFANWYTYNRRREYMAKAAIAKVIKSLKEVRVGILGINGKIKVPLKPVKATINGESKDESDILLEKLYGFQSKGDTPLKEGLETVGEYYKENDGNLAGVSGEVPYPADGGACQQSYVMVMTDGYYSDPNFNAKAKNADADNGEPYADSYSNTLADIAMYYYENDISDYPDQHPTSKSDNAEHQHMVTYAAAFGVTGTLNPADYELGPTNPDFLKHKDSNDYVIWPEVLGVRKPESIDDLWHAAINGRGELLNAGNPQELVDTLAARIQSISKQQRGSAASVSINGDPLYAQVFDQIRIFQSSYSNYNDEWTGDVRAYRLDAHTGEVVVDNPEWSAAEVLKKKDPDQRTIVSYNEENVGILFVESQLTNYQKNALDPDLTDRTNMIAYIRGQEIDGYRSRSQKLGDIVHSAPVFHNDTIYVGANDGMLHAFNAKAPAGGGDPQLGEEIFAYIPNLVFGNLKLLADTAYAHKYFVDLTPVVKEGRGLFGRTEIKTILVGGLGKGGKGYFALDITESMSMTTDKVKWEFPKADTPAIHIDDIGYSFSRPVIAQSYHNTYKWIVIVGNGYSSKNGKSVLFILDPSDGTVITKIRAGAGPDNGLSTPTAVDVNLDDKVDFVYAGDLKGNLWKFDLTSNNLSDWDVAYKDHIGDPQPLFIARGPEENADEAIQPITAKPDVMLHPKEAGYLVCFGTGKFLGDSDYSDRTTQSIYGIWDYGDRVYQIGTGWSHDDDREYLGQINNRNIDLDIKQFSNQVKFVKLLKQERSDRIVGIDGTQIFVRILSNEIPIWLTEKDSGGQLPNPSSLQLNHVGWYFDLSEGERVISDVLIRDGKLIATGFIPDDSRCGHSGNSFFMEINATTGGRFAEAIFDLNDDGSVDDDDAARTGDYVNIGLSDDAVWVPPSGILLPGNIQTPVIIGLGPGSSHNHDDNDCVEVKITTSSTGKMPSLIETCANLGVVYWKEIQQ
ncbi:MAG: PQQ-binding-like beta-propeller repeat protein [Desulfobacterales bacterium]|nr:MAG: PQQ-binding-like beta-propeller repeat protein [Desulfobacterales bacterium]